MTWRSVVIEADGGSRGNPGPAAYGAVLKAAVSGEVIAEDRATIGVATNNVAEYRGLIAGLELAAQFAPDAELEVRMDSKLVVEQMSGRWKIRHEDMRRLALEAHQLAPFGTVYTWVPRAQNSHADRLANEALDGTGTGVTVASELPSDLVDRADELQFSDTETPPNQASGQGTLRGWSAPHAGRLDLVLVRHGVTDLTRQKQFSGGLASSNPSLNQLGRDQALLVGGWLADGKERFDACLASPVARAWETAQILAKRLDLVAEETPAFAEMEFGAWDGLTYAEVHDQHRDDLVAWLDSLDHPPGGGESFQDVRRRVLSGLAELVAQRPNQTLLLVSHVTPIKILIAEAMGVSLEVVYRMELRPGSVSAVTFFLDDEGRLVNGNLRLFNALPQERFSLGV